MRTLPFIGVLAGTIAGATVVGVVAVSFIMRAKGSHHGWDWRVHLANASRSWAVLIREPGGAWEVVTLTPLADGRDYAEETAKAEIDKRRGAPLA